MCAVRNSTEQRLVPQLGIRGWVTIHSGGMTAVRRRSGTSLPYQQHQRPGDNRSPGKPQTACSRAQVSRSHSQCSEILNGNTLKKYTSVFILYFGCAGSSLALLCFLAACKAGFSCWGPGFYSVGSVVEICSMWNVPRPSWTHAPELAGRFLTTTPLWKFQW